jgi:hypothetical protein
MKTVKLGIGLCGGVNDDGSLPIHVLKRVLKLVDLFKKGKINTILYTTGKSYRGLSTVGESESMRAETMRYGIPPEKIHCEVMSRDTYGNAAFSRALFIDPRGVKDFIVVTSTFHMPKSILLFDHVFPNFQGYNIKYIEVDDQGIDPNALKKRIAHEEFSCEFYQKEILPETTPGDISEILKWQFEKNPSHAVLKDAKWTKFTLAVQSMFSGNPLY